MSSILYADDPGHDWKEIAASSWNVYQLLFGGSSLRFDELTEEERIAFEAAIRHAVNLSNWHPLENKERLTELEQGWKGWKPDATESVV